MVLFVTNNPLIELICLKNDGVELKNCIKISATDRPTLAITKKTRTVCRWNDTNPARFWSIPSDPRLTFDPTTYVGVSSSCICLSIMVRLFNIDKKEQFWWKWPFDPWDSKWPQVGIWPHNIGRGSQAYTHACVLLSCYVTLMSYSLLGENDLLTPCDPKWPRMNF